MKTSKNKQKIKFTSIATKLMRINGLMILVGLLILNSLIIYFSTRAIERRTNAEILGYSQANANKIEGTLKAANVIYYSVENSLQEMFSHEDDLNAQFEAGWSNVEPSGTNEDAVTEPETEAKTEAQTEAKTEVQTEAKTEAKAEAQTEAVSEAVSDAKAETEAETKTTSAPDETAAAKPTYKPIGVQTETDAPSKSDATEKKNEPQTELVQMADSIGRRRAEKVVVVDDPADTGAADKQADADNKTKAADEALAALMLNSGVTGNQMSASRYNAESNIVNQLIAAVKYNSNIVSIGTLFEPDAFSSQDANYAPFVSQNSVKTENPVSNLAYDDYKNLKYYKERLFRHHCG